MNRRQGITRRQAGFTIIELLIATLIFSMILTLVTIGVISFTRQYFKGLNSAKTQNAARIVLENITSAIELTGGQVTSPIGTTGSGDSKGFCLGDRRYSYLPGWQLADGTPDLSLNQTRHALVADEPGNCGGLQAQNLANNTTGTELLSPGMRVAKLSVERIGLTDMYRVSIRILYGDNDLLYSPSRSALGPQAPDATCRVGDSGSQYCATAELSTIATKRIVQEVTP